MGTSYLCPLQLINCGKSIESITGADEITIVDVALGSGEGVNVAVGVNVGVRVGVKVSVAIGVTVLIIATPNIVATFAPIVVITTIDPNNVISHHHRCLRQKILPFS